MFCLRDFILLEVFYPILSAFCFNVVLIYSVYKFIRLFSFPLPIYIKVFPHPRIFFEFVFFSSNLYEHLICTFNYWIILGFVLEYISPWYI